MSGAIMGNWSELDNVLAAHNDMNTLVMNDIHQYMLKNIYWGLPSKKDIQDAASKIDSDDVKRYGKDYLFDKVGRNIAAVSDAISEHRALKNSAFAQEIQSLMKTDVPAAAEKLQQVYSLAATEVLAEPTTAWSWSYQIDLDVEVNIDMEALQAFLDQQ